MMKRIIALMVMWLLTSVCYGFDVEYITNTTCSQKRATKHCINTRTASQIVRAVHVQAALYDVPESLVWKVMKVESVFNPKAKSVSGARGLMQVIPYWHKDKIAGRPVDDIDVNIEVGVRILKEYMVRYGSTQRALQAYVGNTQSLDYVRAVYAVKRIKYTSVHPLAQLNRTDVGDQNYARLSDVYREQYKQTIIS